MRRSIIHPVEKYVDYIVIFAMFLWSLWLLHPAITETFGIDLTLDKMGQWGDSFGALNALFATFGFAAALYTLKRQQQQIAQERFDSTFFELLKLLLEARNRVEFKHSSEYRKFSRSRKNQKSLSSEDEKSVNFIGVDAFHEAWLEMRFWTKNRTLKERQLADIYEHKIHNKSENTFGPYFRILYTILKRIETDKFLTIEDKYLYSNLVRSQLSGSEIAIAGLNGLSKISKDFKNLVVMSRLLKYSNITVKKFFRSYYPDEVFEGREHT